MNESPPPAGDESPAPAVEEAPRLAELLPQSLDEALPLLIVPACSLAWALEGGSPERALAGLLVGVALAALAHALLRRRALQSPLSRALPLAGALAGLPPRPLPMLAAAFVLGAALLLFRPPLLSPRTVDPEPEPVAPEGDTGDSLLQSELPFGVFLGAAALIALIWGEPLLDWYLSSGLGVRSSQ